MIIERDTSKFTISSQESILVALKKIVDTEGRILFVVAESGVLEGLFTNGDLLR